MDSCSLPVRRPEGPPTVDRCVGELQLVAAAYITNQKQGTHSNTCKTCKCTLEDSVWNVEAILARLLGEPSVHHIQEDQSALLLPV